MSDLPFLYVNVAMTADGKIAPANRHFVPFGSQRDQEHLLELRTSADAVMSGARTLDLGTVTLGPGSGKYRRQRVKQGLPEYNLRVVVSGSGTIDPESEIFKHRFSPILLLTSGRASKRRLKRLESLADQVKIFGEKEIDFTEAFKWLRKEWNVKRLLCEGGGELNGALFKAGLVDELHLTICPLILGGYVSPTLSDGEGIESLAQATQMQMVSKKRMNEELFLVYRRGESNSRRL